MWVVWMGLGVCGEALAGGGGGLFIVHHVLHVLMHACAYTHPHITSLTQINMSIDPPTPPPKGHAR